MIMTLYEATVAMFATDKHHNTIGFFYYCTCINFIHRISGHIILIIN